jgi:hypothetical protein
MTDQDNLILEQPESLKILEILIGETIPIVNEINEDSFGIQIENKRIIGLSLANCDLTEFPEPITKITTLKILTLKRNMIMKIPESIGNLTSLESLDLRYNKLESLPDTFWKLKNLKDLLMKGNNWRDEWGIIQNYNTASVLKFCRGNAPLNLYIAFPQAFGQIYRIEEFIRGLKSNKEILEIYHDNIEKVAQSHILLLFCTKNSRNEEYFIESMSLALLHQIEIIPIKDTSIDWDDLNQIDLSKKNLGYHDLGNKKGFTITTNNVRSLAVKIYDYIKQYKRTVNLLETEKEQNHI